MKNTVQKAFLFALILASPAAHAISDYAESIKNYCTAKAAFPLTDSRSVCLGNARSNAKGYRTILQNAQANIDNKAFVQGSIKELVRRLNQHSTVAGKDLSKYLGTRELRKTLKDAYTEASKPKSDTLSTLISTAIAELEEFVKTAK